MTTERPPQPDITIEITRAYLLERRRAILVEVCAIEKALGLPRTVPNRDERRESLAAERWKRNPPPE
ncbi:MAG: hypothetical protein H7Y32_12870 [Chloroflexales bacterium]|nr:hypothetical protein [Chloroflexales bacterium]